MFFQFVLSTFSHHNRTGFEHIFLDLVEKFLQLSMIFPTLHMCNLCFMALPMVLLQCEKNGLYITINKLHVKLVATGDKDTIVFIKKRWNS